MLYIVKVYESGEVYEYKYGNMDHALEHYANESMAKIVQYHKGKELVLRSKINGKELEV